MGGPGPRMGEVRGVVTDRRGEHISSVSRSTDGFSAGPPQPGRP